jgi:nickel/cobalt exporter
MEHDWEHEHLHKHGPFGHTHHQPKPGERISLGSLFALGISGGLVPCPAAFALLLAAVSAGAVAKGLSLVLVFSLGLAAALVAIGIGVVKTAGFAGRFMDTERVAPNVALASAVLVTGIGVVTLVESLKHIIP